MTTIQFLDYLTECMEMVTAQIGADISVPIGMTTKVFIIRNDISRLKKELEELKNEAD